MRFRLPSALLVLLALSLTLTGCDLFAGFPGTGGGNLLTVDANSHLVTAATYDTGNFKQTFNTDGSFERTWSSYDSGTASYTMDNGDRGTYTYDPATVTLSLKVTSSYDSNTSSWIKYSSSASKTAVSTVALLEHSALTAYLKKGSTWEATNNYQYTDSSANYSTSDNYVTTRSYAAGKGGFTYKYVDNYKPNGQSTRVYYQADSAGDVVIAPQGASLTANTSVTFNITYTSSSSRSWNYSTSSLDPAVNQSLGYFSDTVFNSDDKFIVFYPTTASRDLASATVVDVPPVPRRGE